MIEKNIPINEMDSYVAILAEMEVGDSFAVSFDNEQDMRRFRSYMSQRVRVARERGADLRISIRRIDELAIRIWRVVKKF